MSIMNLHYYQAIQEQMKQHNQEPVQFDDVKNEIFDMVKPLDPLKITLQDIIKWSVHFSKLCAHLCLFESLVGVILK